MNGWLALAALGLAALSLLLFVFAIRRLLTRQEQVTVTMLPRYDERLATLAQSLNDALTTIQTAPVAGLDLADDPEPMVRALELARERTAADGAIALVTRSDGAPPLVATVGLSESETNHIARMGFPD